MTRIFCALFVAFACAACGTDDPVVAEDAGDTSVDAPTDAAEDSDVTESGVACGGETCAVGEVCFVECLCCGVDTGNPSDHQSSYTCVAPPSCDGTPAECVANERGCYASGELECMSPCA